MPDVDDVRRLGARLSNWGRWGPDDELGTLNYITPEKRAVRGGLGAQGPGVLAADPHGSQRPDGRPTCQPDSHDDSHRSRHRASRADGRRRALHRRRHVPLPAVRHRMGRARGRVLRRPAVQRLPGVGSRQQRRAPSGDRQDGVVVRVARRAARRRTAPWRRVPRARRTGSDAAELDAVSRAQGIEVTEGDILFVRTGVLAEWGRTGSWSRYHESHPGLTLDALEWLHDQRVAAVASDNGSVEGVDKQAKPLAIPLHMVALRDMGLSAGRELLSRGAGRGLRAGRCLGVPAGRGGAPDRRRRRGLR